MMRGGWLLFLCCSCLVDFIIAGLLDFIILIAEIRMKRSSLRGGSCIFLCRSWSRCRQLLSLPTHVLVNERNIFTKPKQIFYTAKTNISHHQKKCFTPVEEIFLHRQKKHWQKKYFYTVKLNIFTPPKKYFYTAKRNIFTPPNILIWLKHN